MRFYYSATTTNKLDLLGQNYLPKYCNLTRLNRHGFPIINVATYFSTPQQYSVYTKHHAELTLYLKTMKYKIALKHNATVTMRKSSEITKE